MLKIPLRNLYHFFQLNFTCRRLPLSWNLSGTKFLCSLFLVWLFTSSCSARKSLAPTFLWNKFDPNKSYNNGKSVYLQKNHWDCKIKLYQAHSIVYSFVKFIMFVQCFLSLGLFGFFCIRKKKHLCFKLSLVQPFSIEERGDHCFPRGQMLILCEIM